MSDSLDFTKRLIKGKIAEIIFQQMILDGGIYEITPLGYEHSLPHVAHKAKYNENIKDITDQIRHTPDFVLTEKTGNNVYLVEVKYRKEITEEIIEDIALKLSRSWKHSWLFIMTNDRLYMNYCSDILNINSSYNNKINTFIENRILENYLPLMRSYFE